MFESVTITVDDNLDVGLLAEAMVYYGRVNVVISAGTLQSLIQHAGYDNVIKCLDHNWLTLTYEREKYCVQTVESPVRLHDLGVVSLFKTEAGKRIRSAADEIEIALQRHSGRSTSTRLQARELGQRIKERKSDKEILKLARGSLSDSNYLRNAIREFAKFQRPASRSRRVLTFP